MLYNLSQTKLYECNNKQLLTSFLNPFANQDSSDKEFNLMIVKL